MMLDNIVKYLKRKPNVAAMTGKAIVKKYLESAFYKESEQMYLGTKLSNFMSDDFEEIAEFVKDNYDQYGAIKIKGYDFMHNPDICRRWDLNPHIVTYVRF